MKNKRNTLTIIGVVIVLFVGTIATILIQAQSDKTSVTKQTSSNLPIVDFDSESNLQLDELRKKRNSKYDLKGQEIDAESSALKENSRPNLVILQSAHAPIEPAFPIAASDIVVSGEVLAAQAHLSNDKTAVYSEFKVQVKEVINQKSSGFTLDGLIDVERLGGGVRFPSGKVVLRPGEYGRNLPQVGSSYVFFLKRNPDDSFSIITGYRISGGRIFPLDSSPKGENKIKQFANYERYDNAPEEVFWADLRESLNQLNRTLKEEN